MASGKIPVAGIPDVWGHDFSQPKEVPTPPVIVLRAAGGVPLGQRTGNMLVGKVASTGADENGMVNDTLYIERPDRLFNAGRHRPASGLPVLSG